VHYGGRMQQIIRDLKRQAAGEKLEPEQLKALVRAGHVYRIGDEHHSRPGVHLKTGRPIPFTCEGAASTSPA
jgi:hypothetical protein